MLDITTDTFLGKYLFTNFWGFSGDYLQRQLFSLPIQPQPQPKQHQKQLDQHNQQELQEHEQEHKHNDKYYNLHTQFYDMMTSLESEQRHMILCFLQDGRFIFPKLEIPHEQKSSRKNRSQQQQSPQLNPSFKYTIPRKADTIEEGEVTLKRAPFTILFLFSRSNLKRLKETDFGVYLCASEEKLTPNDISSYITGRADEDLFGFYQLIVSNNHGVLQYYEKHDDHTFDYLLKTDHLTVGAKQVKYFVQLGDNETNLDTTEAPDTLYIMSGERGLKASSSAFKNWKNTTRIGVNFKD